LLFNTAPKPGGFDQTLYLRLFTAPFPTENSHGEIHRGHFQLEMNSVKKGWKRQVLKKKRLRPNMFLRLKKNTV